MAQFVKPKYQKNAVPMHPVSGGAKQEKVMNKDSKAIVVFFSHAGDNYAVGNIEVGNTKIVADYISKLTYSKLLYD